MEVTIKWVPGEDPERQIIDGRYVVFEGDTELAAFTGKSKAEAYKAGYETGYDNGFDAVGD